MDPGTQVHERAIGTAKTSNETGSLTPIWDKFKLVALRSIFWSYERATWQYDIIVLLILGFIFLTPRSWFRDHPTLQLTDLRHTQGVVEVAHDKATRRYLIDSRLVGSMAPTKVNAAIGEILQRRLKKSPTIKSIAPIRDKNNVILGYSVVVIQ